MKKNNSIKIIVPTTFFQNNKFKYKPFVCQLQSFNPADQNIVIF